MANKQNAKAGFAECSGAESERLCVVRPANPKEAIEMAQDIAAMQRTGKLTPAQAVERFHAMIGHQPYTFRGWLSSDGKGIEDERGNRLEELRPGDSFVKFKKPQTEREMFTWGECTRCAVALPCYEEWQKSDCKSEFEVICPCVSYGRNGRTGRRRNTDRRI